jgi:DNA-binding transcriptional ArsR family regulator
MAEGNDHFDSSRAELFDALGHPVRVKILRALDGKSMSFSELKKETGIDSGGHLQFHLGKLSGLITTDQLGNYKLTGEGQEALRVAQVALRTEPTLKTRENYIARPFMLSIVAISIVWAIIVIASSVVLQGSSEQSIIVILGIGFIACLLILATLGRR